MATIACPFDNSQQIALTQDERFLPSILNSVPEYLAKRTLAAHPSGCDRRLIAVAGADGQDEALLGKLSPGRFGIYATRSDFFCSRVPHGTVAEGLRDSAIIIRLLEYKVSVIYSCVEC